MEFGPPWVRKGRTTMKRRPDHRARRPVTACLPGISHYFPAFPRGEGGEPVSQCSPFSAGLTTSAVSHKMNPC